MTSEMKSLPQSFRLDNQNFVALWPQNDLKCLLTAGSAEYLQEHKDQHHPITVISVGNKQEVSSEWLADIIKHYDSTDDVFCRAFLNGVLFTYVWPGSFTVTTEVEVYLKSQGTKLIGTHRVASSNVGPLPGPYLHFDGSLLPVWKLYEDSHGAFLEALVPGKTHEPSELGLTGKSPQSLFVAVPSRVPSDPAHESGLQRQLEGWRIAVKDNFDIQNNRTSACNRAYYKLYPPASSTALCIKRLEDAGASIVGKTKLASFAATEEPVECIDWQAPWNPRGDGYQSPAGSSSGSGAAIAAYSWLDICIGSDTSGSGRRPGHWNGCFAMRPTHGLLPHDGFLKSFPRFDCPTFFGRDLGKCKHFAKCWYASEQSTTPKDDGNMYTIIYPRDYISVISNKEQVKIIDKFVTDLEASLGVSREVISFDDLWSHRPPKEAEGQSLQEYMKGVARNSFFYDDYHNFNQFRADYKRKFKEDPYVSPPVRWQWYVL
ncbi:MAG: hypothetical protein M1822_000811 [Bathelium mastoideum]|nr:MAG: hypothetical protein M1822_000811 [Bathelium mastoideum]